ATRRYEYRRVRRDGTPIDDMEWMLSQVEANAAAPLRALRESWPPTVEEKFALAAFFAQQALRGPRWKAEYLDQHELQVAEYRARSDDPPELVAAYESMYAEFAT